MLLDIETNLPIMGTPSHDLTRPLSHYWVNSSHNTVRCPLLP